MDPHFCRHQRGSHRVAWLRVWLYFSAWLQRSGPFWQHSRPFLAAFQTLFWGRVRTVDPNLDLHESTSTCLCYWILIGCLNDAHWLRWFIRRVASLTRQKRNRAQVWLTKKMYGSWGHINQKKTTTEHLKLSSTKTDFSSRSRFSSEEEWIFHPIEVWVFWTLLFFFLLNPKQ